MERLVTLAVFSSCLLATVACRTSGPGDREARAGAGDARAAARAASEPERAAVERVLDDFHRAAAEADAERYFAHLAEDAIFLGTDATERWTKPEFRAYAGPHFASGKGWTYEVRERHVFLDGGDVAWFDERLWNAKYGECRGTGVLQKLDGTWRIAHYSLSLPIPNGVVPELLQLLKSI
jgi:ketosteroid isomerase-like protein